MVKSKFYKISKSKIKLIELELRNFELLWKSKKEGKIFINFIQHLECNQNVLLIFYNSTLTKKFNKLTLLKYCDDDIDRDNNGRDSHFVSNDKLISELLKLYNDFIKNKNSNHFEVDFNPVNKYFNQLKFPLDFENFKQFLKIYQKQQFDNGNDNDYLIRLFDKFSNDQKVLHLVEFLFYLQSNENLIFNNDNEVPLHYPLYDYFINSSHNTYLQGNQLSGTSTIVGYVRSLLLGCRSVEIDVWNGDDGRPIVYHGHTLTLSIPFLTILQTIKDFAFISSDLPLILSVETHCDVHQQDIMADMLINVFGDSLITNRLDCHSASTLPSPSQLKRKILFKTKHLYLDKFNHLVSLSPEDSFSSSENSSSDVEKSTLTSFLHKVRRKSSDSLYSSSTSSSTSNTSSSSSLISNKMSQKLINLLVYTIGVKCKGFNKKESYPIEHIFSLSDRSAKKLINNSKNDIIKHNRNHLTRIYPHGGRFKSTNFDPLDHWSVGCQLIALNFQTIDINMWFNFAMFNNNQGYVLKPSPLRKKDDKALLNVKYDQNFKFNIISGIRLPNDNNKQLQKVEIEIYIPKSFNIVNHFKKSTIALQYNSANLNFNQELNFKVPVISQMANLVIIKFNLLSLNTNQIDNQSNNNQNVIASYSITLSNIRQGEQ